MSTKAIPPAATEFIVLTGFLGTGKTTLLGDFLAQPEAGDTAVIINEVGQVNVDGAIIAETGWALPVALLSNGCVCCTVSNDLLFTIEALVEGQRQSGRPPFARIVLECSGLSRPAAVLRSLGELAQLQMKVRIVATLDAKDPPLARSFDDAVAQLAAAQRIVLTKTEGLNARQRDDIVTQVQGLNPFAEIVDQDDRRARALAAFQPGAVDHAAPRAVSPAFAGVATTHPRIEVMFVRFAQAPAWAELQDWIENLVGLCGQRLLRLKGVVPVADAPEPLLIQGVGNSFSPPQRMRRAPAGEHGLVIIARDIDVDTVRAAQLGCDATYTSSMPPRFARRPPAFGRESDRAAVS